MPIEIPLLDEKVKVLKTKFVILGFLLNDSLSGYEIGEMIKQSTNNFWQESDASTYPTLKLLTKEGFVSAEPVYVGKRRKEFLLSLMKAEKHFWNGLKDLQIKIYIEKNFY